MEKPFEGPLLHKRLIEDNLRFFLTGDPINELGVAPNERVLVKEPCRVNAGDRRGTSLSIGCSIGRCLMAIGVTTSGEAPEDALGLEIEPLSEPSEDSIIKIEAVT